MLECTAENCGRLSTSYLGYDVQIISQNPGISTTLYGCRASCIIIAVDAVIVCNSEVSFCQVSLLVVPGCFIVICSTNSGQLVKTIYFFAKMKINKFFVANRGGNYGPFQGDTSVVFNVEITNVGDLMSTLVSTGIFKAPVAGYYCFTFAYKAAKNQKSGLSLMKNNSIIVKTSDDNKNGPDFTDNASNTACLDQVSVVLPAQYHVWAADRVTTFSGFLISEI
uniref:C1q domain-containing protein n=1 Tax=Mola mola TaxID=94237 RepID=A0A3Q3WME5_MOLML